jgi:hypothetical protein
MAGLSLASSFFFVSFIAEPARAEVAIAAGSGTLTGIFVNPIPNGPDPINPIPTLVEGVGTSQLTFGNPAGVLGFSSSVFTFEPFDFTDQPKGQTFVAGKLNFFNGTSAVGSAISQATLKIQTFSSDLDFNQLLSEELGIINTPNINVDPLLNADAVFFLNRPELGYFFVNEDEETDIEILVEFNSLNLIGFGAIGDPSVGNLSPTPQPIPEPLTLLGASAAIAFGAGFKRRKSGKN